MADRPLGNAALDGLRRLLRKFRQPVRSNGRRDRHANRKRDELRDGVQGGTMGFGRHGQFFRLVFDDARNDRRAALAR